MTFEEILAQVREQLQHEGRVAYRILKRRFDLSDDDLEDLKADLIDAKRVAVDEKGKVLVWTGATPVLSSEFRVLSFKDEDQNPVISAAPPLSQDSALRTQHSSAERRQLTVMFCDLVGSTALSEQLDPEEYREVVRAYQETCTTVIRRYAGHIAQHLGDGLLVYFGYPVAHEDDAQRAVRAALGIIAALQRFSSPSPFQGEGRGEGNGQRVSSHTPHPSPLPKGARGLPVRIGLHTGLVVIGEIGSGEKREILALGETPNLAARIQGMAQPDEVVISAATYHLVEGLFTCEDRGQPKLKGISTPLTLYRVVKESEAHSRFEVVVRAGLTPLVGRDLELGLLRERWVQAKDGAGQVVLLSGEPGIGKSRLVQTLKEQVTIEGATRIEFRCSPYHQNSAFHPLIEHLQRLLQFAPHDTPQAKVGKLHQALLGYRFPQADTLPLLAALLSLPHPEGAPPLTLSPQKQKQKTQEALVAWIVEEAEKASVYCAWEDLHWADPSTLEVLTLYLEQIPTTRIFTVLTFRPDFTPPWGLRSYLTQLTLSRLGSRQVREMVSHVAAQAARASTGSARTDNRSPSDSDSVRPELVEGRIALSDDLIDAVIARTDGVPLFVEELTKMVIETMRERATGNGDQEDNIVGVQPVSSSFRVGVPATLQDALMARLDRLGPAKEIAQMGATLGREFSYEVLHAVAPLDEATLQQGLRQLVEAELIYQNGVLPQARYLFKHALVQETAYQSLLKSRRQQLHQQIAQALAERFAETVETQPELLAHHYTEASLIAQAIPYWQQAGERASQRCSAYVEAVAHFTRGLELLKTLPDAPERAQQELMLQILLGGPVMATKGYGAPEAGKAYGRALELCRQVGETPQLFEALFGLWVFYHTRAEYQTALQIGEQLLTLAQRLQEPTALVWAHHGLGVTLFHLGEIAPAYAHQEQGVAIYNPQQHNPYPPSWPDPGVDCLSFTSWGLWYLGYPDQALQKSHEGLALARQLSRPYSMAFALSRAALFHLLRREEQLVRERAEALIALSTEQGFPPFLAFGTFYRGWALAEQGQGEEGIAQMRQVIAALRPTGAESDLSFHLGLLAEAYGKVGQVDEGLTVLAERLTFADKTGQRINEAELYRLKGELLLQQAREQATGDGQQGRVTDP